MELIVNKIATYKLFTAVNHDRVETAREALKEGAIVNVADKMNGNTLLHRAKSLEMTRLLLRYGAIEVVNRNGMAPSKVNRYLKIAKITM